MSYKMVKPSYVFHRIGFLIVLFTLAYLFPSCETILNYIHLSINISQITLHNN